MYDRVTTDIIFDVLVNVSLRLAKLKLSFGKIKYSMYLIYLFITSVTLWSVILAT